MEKYIIRRIFISVIVLFGASIVAFLLPRLTSGDPVLIYMSENATPEMLEQAREHWGLNDPYILQYYTFIKKALSGDMGRSLSTGRPTIQMVGEVFPNTLKLAVLAWTWAVLLGVPLGILTARKRNTLIDVLIRTFAMLGRGMPHFWLGIMMIFLFASRLRWLPSSGLGEGIEQIKYLIMPSFVLGTGTLSLIIRMERAEILEVFQKEYIRTARAKGLRNMTITYRHALKNAVIPLITVMGLEIGALMGGAIVTETVFAYPGIGRLAVKAIYDHDYPMIQVLILVFSLTYILINFVVDIIYVYVDPQIRYS